MKNRIPAAGLAAVLVLVAACGRKDPSAKTAAKSSASSPATPTADAPAPTPAPNPIPEAAVLPADVAGAYLACEQTDEPASGAPSQDGMQAGEPEILFGCALVGTDGKKRPGLVSGLAILANVGSVSGAGRLTLKTVAAPAASAWHVLFELPLRVARMVRDLSATVPVAGNVVVFLRQPPADGTVDAPGLPVLSEVRRPSGLLRGNQLLVLKGHGLHGVVSVQLGTLPCGAPQSFGDDLVTCLTPTATAAAPNLTVTVTAAAGVARMPGGFSYVETSDSPCDRDGAREAAKPADNGDAATPYIVCSRPQLEQALLNMSDKTLLLKDNLDLGPGAFTPAPGGTNVTLDGGGFALQGLQTGPVNEKSGLFLTLQSSTVKDLTILGPRVTGGSQGTGALAARALDGTALTGVTIAGGTISGGILVGGVVGSLQNSTLAGVVVDGAVIDGGDYAGGAVGEVTNDGGNAITYADFAVDATISGCGTYCGGVFGCLSSVTAPIEVSNVRARARFGAEGKSAGGVAGASSVKDAALHGIAVELMIPDGFMGSVGGFAPILASTGTVTAQDVVVRGKISVGESPSLNAGGFVAAMGGGQFFLSNIETDVAIEGAEKAGGIIGYQYDPAVVVQIKDALVLGSIKGPHATYAGVVGSAENDLRLDRVLVTGALETTDTPLDAVAAGQVRLTTDHIFWSSEASNAVSVAQNAAGKTSAALRSAATYDLSVWKAPWIVEDGSLPRLAHAVTLP